MSRKVTGRRLPISSRAREAHDQKAQRPPPSFHLPGLPAQPQNRRHAPVADDSELSAALPAAHAPQPEASSRMTDASNPTFEPFITVSLVNGRSGAVWSTRRTARSPSPPTVRGSPAVHVHDGPAARKLAAELNRLADVIDPPPQAVRPFAACTSTPIKPKRRSNKPKKAKRR